MGRPHRLAVCAWQRAVCGGGLVVEVADVVLVALRGMVVCESGLSVGGSRVGIGRWDDTFHWNQTSHPRNNISHRTPDILAQRPQQFVRAAQAAVSPIGWQHAAHRGMSHRRSYGSARARSPVEHSRILWNILEYYGTF